ncbi:Os05g0379500, partial [Oryza sativa Japonica Group]
SPPLSAPAAKTRCRPPHAGSHVLSYKGRTRSGTKAPRSGGSRISAVGARHGAAAMAPQPPPATVSFTLLFF